MDVLEINAPLPFEHDGICYVFFAAPQKVTESLDNLPAFSFEIENVTPGLGSVSWMIWVSPRINDPAVIETFGAEEWPLYDTPPVGHAICKEAAKKLLAHVRKHFGGKVKVLLRNPAFSGFLSNEGRDANLLAEAGDPIKYDLTLDATSEMLVWVYYAIGGAVSGKNETKILQAKRQDAVDIAKINLGGVGDWELVARNDNKPIIEGQRDITGTALYLGAPVRFRMYSRSWQFTIDLEEVQRYVSAELIEEAVAKACNEIYGDNKPSVPLISDVVIDPYWNKA